MHSLLESYLMEVAGQLKPLPTARRDEELREMRQHLSNAIIVNREMGKSEDEAAQNAMEQFGPPVELSANLVWAWRRERTINRCSFWGATLCGLASMILIPILSRPLETLLLSARQHGADVLGLPTQPLILAMFIVRIVIAGTLIARAFPRRTVPGMATAGTVWAAVSLVGALLMDYGWHRALVMLNLEMIEAAIYTLATWAASRWQGRRQRAIRA